ncbi:MAG: nucleoside triphosphate pyrophosphohydrolase [Planctomycetota bacterium]
MSAQDDRTDPEGEPMSAGEEFQRLVDIMSRLRKECPWDRKQDYDSLRQYLLEETYEVLETLDEERYDELPDELGDLLLQVVFLAQIADEEDRFDVGDVARFISEKLVRRHPHVFGEAEAETAGDVVDRWERIKTGQEEKESRLSGVPAHLPALLKAVRMLKKIQRAGIDPFAGQAPEDVAERCLEDLERAVEDGEDLQQRAGRFLLAWAGMAERRDISPEDALRTRLDVLKERFGELEARVREDGGSLAELGEDELEWLGRELGREIFGEALEGDND